MKYLFNLFIFLAIIISCKQNKSIENCKTFTINKNILTSTFEWPQSIKILKTTPLETKEEFLLGAIQKILIEDGKIFILDRKTNALRVFSENGKFLFNVGSHGQGPGEYSEIRDFCLDIQKNDVYILDYQKVKRYDAENGNFRSQFNIEQRINPIRMYYKNNFFYFWEGNTQKDKFTLFQCNKGNIVSGYLPYKNYIIENDRFVVNGDSCLVIPPNGNFCIYQIQNDRFSTKYHIDFGDMALSDKTLITSNNSYEIDKNPLFNMITDVRETPSWLHLFVVGPNAKYYQILINKKTGDIVSGRPDFVKCAFRIIYTKDDVFYALAEPEHILSSPENSLVHNLKRESILEDDNPVLFTFKIE